MQLTGYLLWIQWVECDMRIFCFARSESFTHWLMLNIQFHCSLCIATATKKPITDARVILGCIVQISYLILLLMPIKRSDISFRREKFAGWSSHFRCCNVVCKHACVSRYFLSAMQRLAAFASRIMASVRACVQHFLDVLTVPRLNSFPAVWQVTCWSSSVVFQSCLVTWSGLWPQQMLPSYYRCPGALRKISQTANTSIAPAPVIQRVTTYACPTIQ